MHAGTFGEAKRQGQTADQESRVRAHKIAQAINATWVPNRRYGGVNGGVQGPSKRRAMCMPDLSGYLVADSTLLLQLSCPCRIPCRISGLGNLERDVEGVNPRDTY
eukprot:374913-Pelagomonas_calceolata.AAC.1